MSASQQSVLRGTDAEIPVWFVFFCASSVGMQLLNKAIAVSFKDAGVHSMDNLLMIWQQLAAIGLNFVCINTIGGDVWRIKPVSLVQVKRVAFATVIFVFMLICSLKALKTVHVATVVVARNLCTVAVCAGEALFFKRYSTRSAVLGLLFIVLGSVVYGFYDLSFELHGYLWQLANSLFFITAQLIEKWVMTETKSKDDQTPLGMSTIKNSLSVPVLLCMMVVNGDWSFDGVDLITRWTWLIIIFSGIGCCCLSIVYMMLYKLASATAIAVGGNVNKVITIILAAFLFKQPMGSLQKVGLAISLAGSLYYSVESSRARKDKP
jgi:drug/metabolite transporter (DMT)-like permease